MSAGRDLTRRVFLSRSGAVAGIVLGGGRLSRAFDGTARPSLVQKIDQIRMYLTHYSLFEEPDPEIPAVPYVNVFGRPDHSLELPTPIAEQRFTSGASDPNGFVETSASFSAMPYRIEPPGFADTPAPAPVVGLLQLLLGIRDPAEVRAHLQTVTLAVGHFLLPPPFLVTARRDEASFAVTKLVRFRVQVRLAFVYDDGVRALGVLTPFVTNGLAATFLGIPNVPHPHAALTYEWHGEMTLSTSNRYVRPVAGEPPPAASPFPVGMTEIDISGSPVDDEGRYTIAGSVSRPQFIDSPVSSVPEILQILFGSINLTDVELAVSESGVLAPAED